MYKIYCKNIRIILDSYDNQSNYKPSKTLLTGIYRGSRKQVIPYIDLAEKNSKLDSIVIFGKEMPALWEDFCSCFKILLAAGGLVQNPGGKSLFMYRRGYWDLPKGKVDKGETPEEAAIREVQEETGLQKVDLGKKITTTYHIYRDEKQKRILKPTHWFQMQTQESILTPQTEEDIEKAVWLGKNEFLKKHKTETYGNILDVISKSETQDNDQLK